MSNFDGTRHHIRQGATQIEAKALPDHIAVHKSTPKSRYPPGAMATRVMDINVGDLCLAFAHGPEKYRFGTDAGRTQVRQVFAALNNMPFKTDFEVVGISRTHWSQQGNLDEEIMVQRTGITPFIYPTEAPPGLPGQILVAYAPKPDCKLTGSGEAGRILPLLKPVNKPAFMLNPCTVFSEAVDDLQYGLAHQIDATMTRGNLANLVDGVKKATEKLMVDKDVLKSSRGRPAAYDMRILSFAQVLQDDKFMATIAPASRKEHYVTTLENALRTDFQRFAAYNARFPGDTTEVLMNLHSLAASYAFMIEAERKKLATYKVNPIGLIMSMNLLLATEAMDISQTERQTWSQFKVVGELINRATPGQPTTILLWNK